MGGYLPAVGQTSQAGLQAPELGDGMQSPMDVVGAGAPLPMSPIEQVEGAVQSIAQMHQGVMAIVTQFNNMDQVSQAGREVAQGLVTMAAAIQAEAQLGAQDELPPG